MSRSPIAAALLAAALSAAPAAAAPDPCAGSTQADLDSCAAAGARKADAALNAAYDALMRRIGPRAREALRAAQKAWLPYRDATCALETTGVSGGSMEPMVRAQCLARVTAERAGILKGYLTCEEGDASCVGRFAE